MDVNLAYTQYRDLLPLLSDAQFGLRHLGTTHSEELGDRIADLLAEAEKLSVDVIGYYQVWCPPNDRALLLRLESALAASAGYLVEMSPPAS